jgi:hypothetical protein
MYGEVVKLNLLVSSMLGWGFDHVFMLLQPGPCLQWLLCRLCGSACCVMSPSNT